MDLLDATGTHDHDFAGRLPEVPSVSIRKFRKLQATLSNRVGYTIATSRPAGASRISLAPRCAAHMIK
jgi:hypothetical protein